MLGKATFHQSKGKDQEGRKHLAGYKVAPRQVESWLCLSGSQTHTPNVPGNGASRCLSYSILTTLVPNAVGIGFCILVL